MALFVVRNDQITADYTCATDTIQTKTLIEPVANILSRVNFFMITLPRNDLVLTSKCICYVFLRP